ncbi:unnamed protein product, partial [Mesorhabditis belari]|uniref:SGNH hydrolase-type esterase domain-containing protein n=1 Tax=Mesorhabditis belari TaxID=2138241 RepID=A0AAF3EK74_9BILA
MFSQYLDEEHNHRINLASIQRTRDREQGKCVKEAYLEQKLIHKSYPNIFLSENGQLLILVKAKQAKQAQMSAPRSATDRTWLDTHECFVSEVRGKEADVIFVGDDHIALLGQSTFYREKISPLHCLTFGIIGDTIENVRWRVENGELDEASAKIIVLSIGCNVDEQSESVDGFSTKLVTLSELIRQKQPQAQLFVLKMLPSGRNDNPGRKFASAVNEGLDAKLKGIATVLDVEPTILNSEGRMDSHLMFDFRHLTQEGMPPSTKRGPLPIHFDPSAIRARYLPEVRGMPRYRHFLGSANKHHHQASASTGIDRADYVAELPQLIQPARQYQVFRDEQNPTLDITPGVTALTIVKKRRIRKNKEILPSLKPNDKKNEKPKERSETLSEAVEKKRNSVALSNSTSSEASIRSFTGVRLHDELSSAPRARNFEYSNGHLLNGIKEDADSLSVKQQPTRSKSAHDMLDEPFEPIPPTTSTHSLRDTRDIAIQTTSMSTQTTLDHSETSTSNAIGTQTETMPILIHPRRRSEAYNQQLLEEQSALMELIDEALDETIDRYSRLRANQIIASSARRQAQIWKDAKEFVAKILVPQSVDMANKGRAQKRTAAEIVAKIKIYP